MNILPALVAVGYNRPDCMERLMKSLLQAEYPEGNINLVVSIDESNKSNEIENVVNSIGWPYGDLIIRRFDKRQGLKNHVLQCGDLSEKYGAVIILEDDLIVSKSFYYYVIESLSFYKNDKNIAGISLYSHAWNGYTNTFFTPQRNEYDTFFGQFSITWGECWTKSQWTDFRIWYKENSNYVDSQQIPDSINRWGEQSWGKFFAKYIAEKNKYYVIPYTSLSTNYSEAGSHNICRSSSHQVMLFDGVCRNFKFPTYELGIKYDMFFERVFNEKTCIGGIPIADLCMNLNGGKSNFENKKFVATTKKYPVHETASFDLALRPIEQNLIYEVPGEGIYIYKAEEIKNKQPEKFSNYAVKYDMFDISTKKAFYYVWLKVKERIRRYRGRK